MKRGMLLLALLLLCTTVLAPPALRPYAGEPEAQELLDSIVENLRGGGMHTEFTLTVERDGSERQYRLDVISDGAERALIRVIAPAREAGQAFLTVGDQLFVYTPRLGRVLRLPPSGRNDAFLGSDISYSDLAGDEFSENYEASIAERDDDRVVLSLIPHDDAPTPYGEVHLTATLPDLTPRELVFFDQRDTAVRRMILEDVRELPGGQNFPTTMIVEDLTGDGGRTVAQYGDGEFGFEPPERCFTQQALERDCL